MKRIISNTNSIKKLFDKYRAEREQVFKSILSQIPVDPKIKESLKKPIEDVPTKPKPLNSQEKQQKNIYIHPSSGPEDDKENPGPTPLPDQVKLAHWNVNGIRAVVKKEGFKEFVAKDFDIICLNETKIDDIKLKSSKVLENPLLKDYHKYFVYSLGRKGYSGVAILTKFKPKGYRVGMGDPEGDLEGRCLTLEYDNFFVLSVYVPNSKARLLRLKYRVEVWDKKFQDYVDQLEKEKPVIILGDLNVAHKEIDLFEPRTSKFCPGFSDEERESFSRMLGKEWVDVFRHLNPDKVQYTWWSYFGKARDMNLGWRIDYALLKKQSLERVVRMNILDQIRGSDHCPIELVFKNKL